MGLDSVELILAFEKYFKTEIPDREAEQMYRIETVIDYLATVIDVKPDTAGISALLHRRFSSFLDMEPEAFIFEKYDHLDKDFWQQIEHRTRLKIALPQTGAKRPEDGNIFQKIFQTSPGYIAAEISYKRFLEVIAYINYTELAELQHCNSREALTVAVCGITIDRLGLDPYEVYPASSFVDDLVIS